jgi:hypothetical protein
VFVGLLVAATAALTFVNLRGEEGLPDRVRVTGTPTAYRIVYEVESASGPDQPADVTTDVVEVERPFRSLAVTRTGRPPGDQITGGRVTDLNRLLLFQSGEWRELQLAPAMAASDLRLDRVIDQLDETDEVRRVAGRACQVHLAGGPVSGGEVIPVGAVEGEQAEVCIDADGLVLSEVWTKDGELLRSRTAVDVDTDPDFDDTTFNVEGAKVVAPTDGGGSATKVDDDATFGDKTLALREVPKGMRFLGRWSVIRPRLQVAVDPFADQTAGRVAGIASVWTGGPDALVVEQGGVAGGGRAFEPNPNGERIDLGPLDIGEVFTDGRGTEVRVAYTDGSFVRVWGTLPRAEVIAAAKALRPQ